MHHSALRSTQQAWSDMAAALERVDERALPNGRATAPLSSRGAFTTEYSHASLAGWCRACSQAVRARGSVWDESVMARLLHR